MPRRNWKESVKSFFGSHIDPDKDEQLKGTKTEVDDKVKKLLDLLKDEENGENNGIEDSKKGPLVELIQEFHEHYQSLYSHYDHLTGELRKKFHRKKGSDSSSSSSSDSDSDSSSKRKGSKNGRLESEYQKITDVIKQELETANVEIADLKSKLLATSHEKEVLSVQLDAALSKIREDEEIIKTLKIEAENVGAEKEKLLSENGELIQKIVSIGNMEVEMEKRLEGLEKEKETAAAKIEEEVKVSKGLRVVADQLQNEKAILGQELESIRTEVSNVRQQLESAELQVSDLSKKLTTTEEDNKSLVSNISELNQRLEEMNSMKDNLITEKETAAAKIEDEVKVSAGLRVVADQLQNEKAILGQELESIRTEVSNVRQQLESAELQVSNLSKKLTTTEEDNKSLVSNISELNQRLEEMNSMKDNLITEKETAAAKIEEEVKVSAGLRVVADQLQNEKAILGQELESIRTEVFNVRQQLESAELQVSDLSKKLTTTEEDNKSLVSNISELNKKLEEMNSMKDNLITEKETAAAKIEEEVKVSKGLRVVADQLQNEKAILGQELESIRTEVSNVRQQLESAELQVSDLSKKLTTTEEDNKSLVSNISELNQRLEEMNSMKDNLITEKEAAAAKIEEEVKVSAGLRVVADQLQNEKAILGQELESIRTEVSNVRQQLESAELQVSDLSKKLTTAEEDNKSLVSNISELNQRLEEMNSMKDNLITEKETALRRVHEGERITEDLKTLADRLRDEKAMLEHESGRSKEELDKVKQLLESAEQKVSDLTHVIDVTKEENSSLTLKVSEISSEYQQAQNRIQELMEESSNLKEKSGVREREFSSLTEVHESHKSESLQQIKKLEEQIISLEAEIEASRTQARDMEVQIKSKGVEANHLAEENLALKSRISELEVISKAREDEVSVIEKMLEENVNESSSRIESLSAELKEASAKCKCVTDEVDLLQQQIVSTQANNKELEAGLHTKTQEVSECVIEIENLKQQLAIKAADQQRIAEEKESLVVKIKDLELEMSTLRDNKGELEDKMRGEIDERERLSEKMAGLQHEIAELEKKSAERELEFSALEEKHKNGEIEAASTITALVLEVENLQRELDSLQVEKNQMQLELERHKQELSDNLNQAETHKSELISQISDHQKLIEEQENAHKKLSEEYKQLGAWFQDCKANLEAAEEKLEESNKTAGSKEHLVVELEETVDGLKRELEEKGDELNMLVEKVSTIEVKLRLSNQKLRVTEQLLTENEEEFRKAEAKYQEELKALERRVATLCGVITAITEAYQRAVRNISEKVNSTMSGMDALSLKFEEDCSRYENIILEMASEIRITKKQVVDTNSEKQRLGNEVSNLAVQLEDRKERELALVAKVEQLEDKLSTEGKAKENLIKIVDNLEKKVSALEMIMKEKDDGMMDLGEEKREAIRQLCVWIDYHRTRYDHLREVLSKMPVQLQRAA